MKRPKTATISFVTYPEIKGLLGQLADQRDTTVSMVVQELVKTGLANLQKAS